MVGPAYKINPRKHLLLAFVVGSIHILRRRVSLMLTIPQKKSSTRTSHAGRSVGCLIPPALEGGPLWEPMRYVQIAGMLVATLVTLALVPVLYVIFVENLHLVRWETESVTQQASEESRT